MKDRYKFRVLENCKRCGFKYSYYDMTNKGGIQNGWDECEKHCLSERYPTETIEQCTGLKDKNGVLIFEGDKLNCIDIRETHTSEYSGVVVFEDYMWIVKNDECDTYLCYYDDSNCSAVTEIEITGNIHDEKAGGEDEVGL